MMEKISIFQNFTKVIGHRNIVQIIETIKSNIYERSVMEIRKAIQNGNKKLADQKKKHLLGFTISGVFKGGRRLEYLETYRPYVVLDIDHLNEQELNEVQNVIKTIDSTLAGFVSPSGRGYKVIVKTNANLENHKMVFNAVANYYQQKLKLEIDRSGSDVTRLCFFSYDPEAYLNPEANVFLLKNNEIENQQMVPQVSESYEKAFEECVQMTNEVKTYVNGNRNNYTYYLAANCNRAGIAEHITRDLIGKHFDLPKAEIEGTVRSCYKGVAQKNESIPFEESRVSYQLHLPPTFPSKVFNKLPVLLREACASFKSGHERDVFLTGALCVLSGCLPKVQGWYDGQLIFANLYTFVIAPAASGKGVLKFAKELGMAHHDDLQLKNKEATKVYNQAIKIYQRDQAKFQKGELEKVPEEPKLKAKQTLFIPANSSSAKLIKQLRNNDGNGILFETEADTLGNVLKQDWGGYSDVLRKAAHHECISYSRSGNDELVELRKPKLSVCLSGTPNQVVRLIPSVEDGLFSRFLFYYFDAGEEWRKIKMSIKIGDSDRFNERLSQEVKAMITFLDKHPTHFTLREDQEKLFNASFTETLDKVNQEVGSGALSIVKRLGLMQFRISMILTALRKFENQNTDQDMVCEDDDFYTAMWITEVYLKHALFVYDHLPQHAHNSFGRVHEEITEFYESLPKTFKRKEIIKPSNDLGFCRTKVDRFLDRLVPRYLKRIKGRYGFYEKIMRKIEKPEKV